MVPTANLHTHTYRCRHASGDVADYAKVAVAGGLRVLGMADHAPLPDRWWQDHRMAPEELDGYIAAVRAVQQSHASRLTVLLGMECDWRPEYRSWYEDELLGRRRFDYLIAGVHFLTDPDGAGAWIGSFDHSDTPRRLRAYVAGAVATMESGLFRTLTHPDVFGVCNPRFSADCSAAARDIGACAAATGVALELNGYGLRKPKVRGETGERPGYPWPPFWEAVADSGARVMLSSDAHRPQDLLSGFAELAALRDACGLREADPWWLNEPDHTRTTSAAGRVAKDPVKT